MHHGLCQCQLQTVGRQSEALSLCIGEGVRLETLTRDHEGLEPVVQRGDFGVCKTTTDTDNSTNIVIKNKQTN